VVITFSIPGIDYGEDLLRPFDAKVEKGFFNKEEDIIEKARDADAVMFYGES
jgi:outer membrane lipopolysaccharide assembly protein LptE/RlpB